MICGASSIIGMSFTIGNAITQYLKEYQVRSYPDGIM
jgi:hypothetical protein